MLYRTRQDHIDVRISRIEKCQAHVSWMSNPNIVVFFTNGAWVCSSGHNSSDVEPMTLRRPDEDPIEWIKGHPDRFYKSISEELCADHQKGMPTEWGHEGHLWQNRFEPGLTLCLPRTRSFHGSAL